MNHSSMFAIREMPYYDQPAQRISTVGPAAMGNIELLSLILGLPTFEQTHELLKRYPQLSDLTRVSAAELAQIKGIGPATAARIKAAIELGGRAYNEPGPERPKVSSPADAANLFIPRLRCLEQEEFHLIVLNTRNDVLSYIELAKGTINTTHIRISEVFREAIRLNGAAVIVAHNHPSGDPAPSPEDIRITRSIYKMGKELDISLLDHLIIGAGRYVSLKERRLGFDD